VESSSSSSSSSSSLSSSSFTMSNIHVERPYNRKDVTDDKIKRLINDPTFPPKYFSLQASVYGIEDTHERDFGEVLVYGRPSDLAANEDYERLLNRVKGLAKLVKKRLAPIIKLMESVVGQPIDFITTRDKKKKCDMCRYFISVQRDLCYRCDELKGKRAPRDRTERDQNPAQKRKLPNHQTDQKLSSAQKEGNKARGNNTAQREGKIISFAHENDIFVLHSFTHSLTDWLILT
jgi:hypothetical protein